MKLQSAGVIDLAPAFEEKELHKALLWLDRTAAEEGAEAAALLVGSEDYVEVRHFFSAFGLPGPDGKIATGSDESLRHSLSPQSQSILSFRWQMRGTVIITAYAFASPTLPYDRVPDLLDRLNLVALATWSVYETIRLRKDLRAANDRLAGRKLVERAKGLLQEELGVGEQGAYEYMRGLSRKRRITLTALAAQIVRKRRAAEEAEPLAS